MKAIAEVKKSGNLSSQIVAFVGPATFACPASWRLAPALVAIIVVETGLWAGRRDMAQGGLSEDEQRALREQIERLRQEHRDLDAAIEALRASGAADQLQIQRLKKRKLALRDRVNRLENELTPDIIA
jgi:hypothetical protein